MAKKPEPPQPGRAYRKGEVPQTPEQAATPDQDPVKIWGERLIAACKDYDEWAREYRVQRLLEYYLGKHWPGASQDERRQKYVINLIFATVETQLPSLMFSTPKVSVEPRPGRRDEAGSNADGRSTLIQQTLQTHVDDPKIHFFTNTKLALRDVYWRFSLAEVGYTADYIDNPNAGKPVLKDDETPILDSDTNEPLKQPDRTLKDESVFVKRIPPDCARVSPGRNVLEENDWFAYYEWHYVEDVRRNKAYENTAELKATGTIRNEFSTMANGEKRGKTNQVKLWKIWDLRLKVKHVYAEGHAKMLQANKKFEYFPFADLKFYEIPDSYYPLPPLFNWTSPQDEINETRESQRIHRKRASRRYMREPQVTPEEFEKLETGEDMVCIEVPKVNPSPIMPIPDAELGITNWKDLAASHDDFLQITGVGGDQRGAPESTTATQANIVNVRAQIREGDARKLVAMWLGKIVRLILLTIRDQMQLPMQVKQSVDPFAMNVPELARTANTWKQIDAKDLGDIDVDIAIDVASLSPVAEEAQRNAWNVVLALLTNPQLLMVLMTASPEAPGEPSPMLRKTLYLNGIKSDQEVREIWRVGQVILERMAMMAMAQASGNTAGAAGIMAPGGGAPSMGAPGDTSGMPAPGPM